MPRRQDLERRRRSGRILIGRRFSNRDYILTVSSLGVQLGFHSIPWPSSSSRVPSAMPHRRCDLSAYFGLSFAEFRLAIQLMSGKVLAPSRRSPAASTATLRSQLRSILKKVQG